MLAVLKKFDLFGSETQLNTFGEEKFTTTCGGILSILTYIIILIFSYFFGEDFFYKSNPNVVEQERITKKTDFIYPQTADYAFMVRAEDTRLIAHDINSLPYKFEAWYFHAVFSSKGFFEFKFTSNDILTRCSDTAHKDNLLLKDLKLQEWLCVDFDKIKAQGRAELKDLNYQPPFGGDWDEPEVGEFYFAVQNFRTDKKTFRQYDFAKTEDILKWHETNTLVISTKFPDAAFNDKNEGSPLQVYYKNHSVQVTPEMSYRETRYFKKLELQDDSGWLLKDVNLTETIQTDWMFPYTRVNDLSKIRNVGFYTHLFFLDKKTRVISMSYMKLQELGAEIGGFVKFVMMTFGYLAKFYASFLKTLILISKLFTYENKRKEKNSSVMNLQTKQKTNTYIETKAKSSPQREEANKIGFFNYLWSLMCYKSAKKNLDVLFFHEASKKVKEKLDIDYLLKHYEKFDNLLEIVLTPEQTALLLKAPRTMLSL